MPPSRDRDRIITQPVSHAEADRRLRPALDILFTSGNPRQALKVASQAEAKRPGWPGARSVRALALRRIGRLDEAESLALEVLHDLETAAVPLDEDAAVKLHLYFRECPRREHFSARAFEAVAKGLPWDRLLWEGAFFWHIRARDFVAGQRVATSLQRAGAQNVKCPYPFWSTVALWLGNRGPNRNSKLDGLEVAMLSKALASCAVLSAEHVRFAIRVFCKAKRFELARQLLDKTDVIMDAGEVAHLRADVEFQALDVSAAVELYRLMLMEGDVDDWGHWLRLIDLSCGDPVQWAETESLVSCLVARSEQSVHASRGLHIAEMEVLRRNGDWDNLRSKVVQYFHRFSEKPVSSHDLRPFVAELCSRDNIHEDWADALACELDEQVASKHSHDPGFGMNQISLMSLCWLRLWMGLSLSFEDMCHRYVSSLDDAIDETERQQGDDFLLLAAHQLLPYVQGAARYVDRRSVIKTIVLLEAGLTRSPFNFHFKLLLIELYSRIGAVERSFDLWLSLDVKHVQCATLSHLVTRDAVYAGCHQRFDLLNANVDSLWRECERDVPESFNRALSQGSVNAAVEFFEFQERLEKSRYFVDGIICQALVHLSESEGDALGIEKAWNVVGEGARIIPKDLEPPLKVIDNDDFRCTEFWNLSLYDPASFRRDCDSSCLDAGPSMSPIDQALLLVELLVVRGVSRLSARGTVAEDEVNKLCFLVNANNTSEHQSTTRSRMAFLGESFIVIARVHSIMSGTSMVADIVVSEQFATHLHQAVDDLETSCLHVDGRSVLCPRSLKLAGAFVYEDLVLLTVGLTALSKTSLACKSKSARTCALAAVSSHIRILTSVSERILTIVDALAEVGNSAYLPPTSISGEASNADCNLLPEIIPVPSRDTNGIVLAWGCGAELTSTVQNMVGDISSRSASAMARALRVSIHKLKMLTL